MADELVAEFAIVVRQEADTLPGIARQLMVLDQTWVVATAFASHRAGLTAWVDDKHRHGFIPRPDGIRLVKQSPMIVDMAVGDVLPWGLTSGAAGLFVYFVRNPGKLGSFWHDIVASWHNSAAESEEAKRNAWLQRQINKELLGGSPPTSHLSETEQTSWVLHRLGDHLGSLSAEVVDRNESD